MMTSLSLRRYTMATCTSVTGWRIVTVTYSSLGAGAACGRTRMPSTPFAPMTIDFIQKDDDTDYGDEYDGMINFIRVKNLLHVCNLSFL